MQMVDDNLGIGVMTSIKLRDRYLACKATWMKDFSHSYLFGGKKHDKNLIRIKTAGEDWESAFLKQQLGLAYMYKDNPRYNWYCICGCDTVLFRERVINELRKFDYHEDFLLSQPCGLWTDSPYLHEVKIKTDEGNSFRAFAGGAGFFISNSLMGKLAPFIDEFNAYWKYISCSYYGCSDVALAYMAKKYENVDLTAQLLMFSQHPAHYENDDNLRYYDYDVKEFIKTPMSLHYIKPCEMEEIYKKYR